MGECFFCKNEEYRDLTSDTSQCKECGATYYGLASKVEVKNSDHCCQNCSSRAFNYDFSSLPYLLECSVCSAIPGSNPSPQAKSTFDPQALKLMVKITEDYAKSEGTAESLEEDVRLLVKRLGFGKVRKKKKPEAQTLSEALTATTMPRVPRDPNDMPF